MHWTGLKTIIDVGKVWKDVKLEQSIYIIAKGCLENFYFNGVRNGELFTIDRKIDKEYVKRFGFFVSNVSKEELSLGEKIFRSSQRLNEYILNSRGSIYQKLVDETGNVSVMGGKQIQRYHINGIYGRIHEQNIKEKKAHVTVNSILVQRLVAHVSNPVDHIKITATIPKKDNFIIIDTINQLKIKDNSISPYYVLGLLNSKIINWYAYSYIFGKAIRTMQFDNPVTDRIPIIVDNEKDVIKNVKFLLNENEKSNNLRNNHKKTLMEMLSVKEIDGRILNVHKLEFKEFSKLITKISKKRLSIKEISMWIEYFDEEKIKAVEIISKIDKIKNELNILFYDIFKLTKEEIDLIECSTPE